ncbi:MAG: hypothetical protein ACYCS7_11270 [Acidimicrobiales bacterium]
MAVIDIVVFVAAATVVLAVLGSALRTVVVPRGIPARIAAAVFLVTRVGFRLRVGPSPAYARQDRIMAGYAPFSLLALLTTWIVIVIGAFTAMFWALEGQHLRQAFYLSGSSVFTLGFERVSDIPGTILILIEAAIGLLLLALLITYLPSIYTAFSRREATVTGLRTLAGSPPAAPVLIERVAAVKAFGELKEVWNRWGDWFVELEETHTSFPALVFFRSPRPEHSWVTAAGAVLDSASLVVSTVDVTAAPEAQVCIRAGSLALRSIADFYGIPHDPDPAPTDPISITRDEYDQACDHFISLGIPLKPDREQAWRDFAGWRVNYDTVLLGLSGLIGAPTALWSADRHVVPRIGWHRSTNP